MILSPPECADIGPQIEPEIEGGWDAVPGRRRSFVATDHRTKGFIHRYAYSLFILTPRTSDSWHALGKKYLALKPDEESKEDIKLEPVPETPILKYVHIYHHANVNTNWLEQLANNGLSLHWQHSTSHSSTICIAWSRKRASDSNDLPVFISSPACRFKPSNTGFGNIGCWVLPIRSRRAPC
jgi:hypothetical protein